MALAPRRKACRYRQYGGVVVINDEGSVAGKRFLYTTHQTLWVPLQHCQQTPTPPTHHVLRLPPLRMNLLFGVNWL